MGEETARRLTGLAVGCYKRDQAHKVLRRSCKKKAAILSSIPPAPGLSLQCLASHLQD